MSDALDALVLGFALGIYGAHSLAALIALRRVRRRGGRLASLVDLVTGETVAEAYLRPGFVRRARLYAWCGVLLFVGHAAYRLAEIVRAFV